MENEKKGRYVIVPKIDFVSEEIEGRDAGDALANFAASMDGDMNVYFKAIPVEQYGSYVKELRKTIRRQIVDEYRKEEK